MKILMVSTPANGHINPLLAVGQMLMAEGHELVVLTGSCRRDRVERTGAEFRAFPAEADIDLHDVLAVAPELREIPPGMDWLRIALERFFVDRIVSQDAGLQEALQDFPADVIVADDMLFGVLPLLRRPHLPRPPVIVCGTSFLHWRRDDAAPNFLGLPPATTAEERARYLEIAEEYDRRVHEPTADRLDGIFRELGADRLALPLFEAVVAHADAYLQLSVRSFEYPRSMPPTVNFIGTPPIIANQAPLPPWAGDLDGSRNVVLVTQGTVANHNFGLLVAPTLAALAHEPDLLVVVTTGGRPIDTIPGPIPGNARLGSYLPFEWLLPKVDVLVTNGGYGTVNQALSFGVPLVTAGLTEDKADVNARVAWSGVGIDLATNEPTAVGLRDAVRRVLDTPHYRGRAAAMRDEFRRIDTRAEVLRLVEQVVQDFESAWYPQRQRWLAQGHGAARARSP